MHQSTGATYRGRTRGMSFVSNDVPKMEMAAHNGNTDKINGWHKWINISPGILIFSIKNHLFFMIIENY